MRNPLQNEEAAFRFVLWTIVYVAPIVVAAWIATWLGVVVFVLETVVVAAFVRRGSSSRSDGGPAGRAAVEDTWRILVIANETLESPNLPDVITRLADGVAEDVLVICPVTPARPSPGPEGDARAEAEARLRNAVDALRAAHVDARGELGDADPVAALETALRDFEADEILISTHPEGRSAWLEQGLVAAAADRFDGPVTHVVGEAPVPLVPGGP